MATKKANPVEGKKKPTSNKSKPVAKVDGKTPPVENKPPTETPTEEIIEGKTPTVENKPPTETPTEEIIEGETPPIENTDFVEDESKANSSFGITINFRKESESKHVQSIINELVKHEVVTDKSDFAKKCIDFCINHNAVIRELMFKKTGTPSPLQFPYPDGSDGTPFIEPKLLSKSLFEGLVDIPMCK